MHLIEKCIAIERQKECKEHFKLQIWAIHESVDVVHGVFSVKEEPLSATEWESL